FSIRGEGESSGSSVVLAQINCSGNGTRWRLVTGPHIGPQGAVDTLSAITAISTNNVWAVRIIHPHRRSSGHHSGIGSIPVITTLASASTAVALRRRHARYGGAGNWRTRANG